MNATVIAITFMVLAWMVARNRRSSTAEGVIMFLAGLFFWSSGIGSLLWVVTDGIWQEAHTDREGMPVTLALVFLALAVLVTRNRRSSSAESAIMFLGGLFFWSSGIGVALWAAVDGMWHLMGGGR